MTETDRARLLALAAEMARRTHDHNAGRLNTGHYGKFELCSDQDCRLVREAATPAEPPIENSAFPIAPAPRFHIYQAGGSVIAHKIRSDESGTFPQSYFPQPDARWVQHEECERIEQALFARRPRP
jgi:hypothetical protein